MEEDYPRSGQSLDRGRLKVQGTSISTWPKTPAVTGINELEKSKNSPLTRECSPEGTSRIWEGFVEAAHAEIHAALDSQHYVDQGTYASGPSSLSVDRFTACTRTCRFFCCHWCICFYNAIFMRNQSSVNGEINRQNIFKSYYWPIRSVLVQWGI